MSFLDFSFFFLERPMPSLSPFQLYALFMLPFLLIILSDTSKRLLRSYIQLSRVSSFSFSEIRKSCTLCQFMRMYTQIVSVLSSLFTIVIGACNRRAIYFH